MRDVGVDMGVPQHVLNWLYSVLTSNYQDVNRTYHDVAQALSAQPTLAARTDVYTYNNGAPALLVRLHGTLPIVFRGSTYKYPLSIWIPHAYPREPPMVYVTPTSTMMVRPGQHVDASGQVYHPYLAAWAGSSEQKASILALIDVLRDIFTREPPVVASPQQPPMQSPPPQHRPSANEAPPRPPVPLQYEGQSPSLSSGILAARAGPPPPPKMENGTPGARPAAFPSPQPSRYDSAPSLPSSFRNGPPQRSDTAQPSRLSHHPQHPPHPSLGSRYGQAPVSLAVGLQQPGINFVPSTGVSQTRPVIGRPYPPDQQQAAPHLARTVPQQPYSKSSPPPDLMDEPLMLSTPSSEVIAPPVPSNPEKDAILHQLAQTLYQMRQESQKQNVSSLAGLQAQYRAMVNSAAAIQAELGALQQLSAMLTSNTSILHDAMRRADEVITSSAKHPKPDMDQLLIAPTVVGNQLYDLVASEKALGDAIFILGRAVERGRVAPAVFAKTTRSLAREWYLKKALARKVARGMGLVT